MNGLSRAATVALAAAGVSMSAAAQATSGQPTFDPTGAPDTSMFAPMVFPAPNLYRLGSGAPGPRYWQNRADYNLEASLDTGRTTLNGKLRLRYTNNSPDTLRFIWVQMEQNAFRDKSLNSFIFPQESRFGARGFEGGDVVEKFNQVTLRAPAGTPVKTRVEGTMMKVGLVEPLAPGSRWRAVRARPVVSARRRLRRRSRLEHRALPRPGRVLSRVRRLQLRRHRARGLHRRRHW